jgi:hypothetical protein
VINLSQSQTHLFRAASELATAAGNLLTKKPEAETGLHIALSNFRFSEAVVDAELERVLMEMEEESKIQD